MDSPAETLANLGSQIRKAVNYAESDDEDDDPFERITASRARRQGRARAAIVDDDEDEYDAGEAVDEVDDGTLWPPATMKSYGPLTSHR